MYIVSKLCAQLHIVNCAQIEAGEPVVANGGSTARAAFVHR